MQAFRHQASSSGGTYVYDGNGLRVKKASGSNSTVYVLSGSKVIAEYDNGAAVGSPPREYIYSGAAPLAKIDSSGTKYYHQDHLSNRLLTDSSGNTVARLISQVNANDLKLKQNCSKTISSLSH